MQTVQGLLQTSRPHQWLKNTIVFVALIFSHRLGEMQIFLDVIVVFVLFCAIASSVYILNDIMDYANDSRHPTKKKRPIASGQVDRTLAAVVFGLLVLTVLTITWIHFSAYLLLVFVAYLVLNIAYSLHLKHVVLVDVFIVAIGFVLRAVAGAVAIDVFISPWLLAMTFFGALVLVIAKRRHEVLLLAEDKKRHRQVLEEYPLDLIDRFLTISAATAIMTYVLYTMSPAVIDRFGPYGLVYTSFFVVFGVFRVLYLIYAKKEGGAPTRMLMHDAPFIVVVMLWLMSVVGVIYL